MIKKTFVKVGLISFISITTLPVTTYVFAHSPQTSSYDAPYTQKHHKEIDHEEHDKHPKSSYTNQEAY